MFSSYDRRSRINAAGVHVDWDANHDRGQFIREEPDGWHVMAYIAIALCVLGALIIYSSMPDRRE